MRPIRHTVQAVVTLVSKNEVSKDDLRQHILENLGDRLQPGVISISAQTPGTPKPYEAVQALAKYVSAWHPFRQGWDAALAGKPFSARPRFRGEKTARAWEDGWTLAYSGWIAEEWDKHLKGRKL